MSADINTEQPTFANPLPHAMRSGAVLGLMFSANFLLSASTSIVMQALTYIIVFGIVLFTWRYAKNFRDQESNGIISFYRVFSYIMMLFFFAALVSAIVKLVYLKFIDTEYLNRMIDTTMKLLVETKIELPDDYQQSISTMLNPTNFIMQITMFDTFLGAIIGLCFAPFIKKSSNSNSNNLR